MAEKGKVEIDDLFVENESSPDLDALDGGWDEEDEEEEEAPEPELPDEKLDPALYAAAKKAREERIEARRKKKREKLEAKRSKKKARTEALKKNQKQKQRRAPPPERDAGAGGASDASRASALDASDDDASARDMPTVVRARGPKGKRAEPSKIKAFFQKRAGWQLLVVALAIFLGAAALAGILAR